MSEPFKLFRLQQIDSRLDEGLARIAKIDEILSDDTEKNLAELRMKSAEESAAIAEKELRKAEEIVHIQEEKLRQNQSKLYGGSINNPKELQDLQNEAEALNRHLGTLEEDQLERMIAYEAADADKKKEGDALDGLLSKMKTRDAALLDERQVLQGEVDRILGEKEAATQGVPADDLQLYEKLRQKKSGLAVAKVKDNSCTACGSRLSHALAQAARSPSTINLCDTCGRILYSG